MNKRKNKLGVTYSNPSKMNDNGYILFGSWDGKDVWLIDMEGNIINRWRLPYALSLHGMLLPNGNLIYAGAFKGNVELGLPIQFCGIGGLIEERDWDGNLIWSAEVPYQHHDFLPLPNGHIIYGTHHPKGILPEELALKWKGGMPRTEFNGQIWGDTIDEIDRDGRIVWEWLPADHLDPDIDAMCPLERREHLMHINSIWKCKDGNLLVSSRFLNEILRIEYPSGKVLARYGKGEIFHTHDVSELENGNILVFDNGNHRYKYGFSYSRVVEIDPDSDKIIWQYKADPPSDFYSAMQGGAERLSNSNTFITDSLHGRFFEVTQEGEIVWEYINPFLYNTIKWGPGMFCNTVFIAHYYPHDYSGFIDKNMSKERCPWENDVYGPVALENNFPYSLGIARTNGKGLIVNDSMRAFGGVTFITPVNGQRVWMINMKGEPIKHWDFGYEPACYGELLPSGNILYAGKINNGPLSDLEGASGILLEMDWEGNIVWKYSDPYLHNAFYRMDNGNTLVIRWVEVPANVASRIKTSSPGTERQGVMWGDSIQEISRDGKVVWEWIAHEHLNPEVDITCPICPRSEWTHVNAVLELNNGDILVSLMKNNTLIIIDKKSGDITWRWGQGELAHQNSPSVLDNGNILIFDNGLHPNMAPWGISRVLEIDPKKDEIVWSYEGAQNTLFQFYSSTISSCQRLPNGNTFICEGEKGRLFEVTPRGELVWEYVTTIPHSVSLGNSNTSMVYAAFRYGMDYSGLKRPIWKTEKQQAAPGKPADQAKRWEEGKVIESRLKALGY